MKPIIFDTFPAWRVDAAREVVAAIHKRVVRACQREKLPTPVEPILRVSAERIVGRCPKCGLRASRPGIPCATCPTVLLRPYHAVDLELVAPRAVIGPWEFLAVVEPLGEENLIKRVPGSDHEVDLSAYRAGALTCDHCKTARKRNETYIVRRLQPPCFDQPAIILGGGTAPLREVGASCLKSFLGGLSAANLLAALSLESAIRDLDPEGGDGGGGGWGPLVCAPADYLAWVVAKVRLDGYRSSRAAREDSEAGISGPPPTGSQVTWLVDGANGGGSHMQREKWKRERERCQPTEADVARAEVILAWARELAGSDYAHNVSLVARQVGLDCKRHGGILASAVPSWEREHGVNSRGVKHVGEVGKRATWKANLAAVASYDSSYGTIHVHRFVTEDGAVIVWKTGSVRLQPCQPYSVTGTVKVHGEYRGEPQTTITRCTAKPAP